MKQLMNVLFMVGGLGLAACGGSDNSGSSTSSSNSSSCTHEFICENGICACGSDGSGPSCDDPKDDQASPANKCNKKCEVCS